MNRTMRYLVWLVLVAVLVVAPATLAAPAAAPAPAGLAPFDPYILERIKAEGQADFFVVLKLQADVSAADALPTKEAKGRYVFDALTEVAAKTQGPILAELKAEKATFKPFWIRNMVQVRGDHRLLLKMAARPDVAEIIYEYPAIPDVVSRGPAPAAQGTEAVEWNITRVGAPDVWAMGYDGDGAVIGDLDSGVQWDHPALINSYRGNLGAGVYDHNYNWFDGVGGPAAPLDYGSHGTHTMGTIVGDDGGTNQIGMAPGARWIACPGIGSLNVGPTECFQWFLAPTRLDGTDPQPNLAPHVINNSWTSAGTNYHPIIQVLTAAGIFYAKSAGNTGPNCGTVTNPGQWPEVTAAASFANGDTISSFSSRGPVVIGYDTVVKPDIAAPGSGVRSSVPGGNYGSMSGTSMACPHVTGAVALLVDANPALAGHVDVLQMLLKENAEPKTSAQCPPFVDTPNDVWGWGILDIQASVVAGLTVGLGGVEGTVTHDSTPVEDVHLTFADASSGWPLTDNTAADGTYSRQLPAGTYNVTAERYGYLPNDIAGLVVPAGVTATLDIGLQAAPLYTVAGTVTEEGTGTPLLADVIFGDTPVATETDPDTGQYSVQVAEGTWWLDVRSAGHTRQVRQVTIDQDQTQDFALTPVQNYYMRYGEDCGPAFGWMDATGGTEVVLGDDASTAVVLPAGRSFTFYGQSYTNLFIGSNGLVTFGTSSSSWSGPVPNPAAPNNGIYAFSTDLNPASGSQGHVYWAYLDSRYFVVQWNQVQHYPSGDPETFEIVLDLDTGKVTIQYLTISNVADAVAGVENATGTEATQYAYADPVLIDDGKVVDFYPMFSTPPPSGGTGVLHGVVSDFLSGDPIEGATVNAEAFTTGGVTTLTTGPDGAYTTTLCADWYDLQVTAPGYKPYTATNVPVRSARQTDHDVSLEQASADLWLIKDAPVAADPGDTITYTLYLGSNGPDEVVTAEIRDLLSPDVTWISGGTYISAEHAVEWQWANVVSGALGSQTLVVQIAAGYTGTAICNTATITAINLNPPLDPVPANNSDEACTSLLQAQYHVYLPVTFKVYP